jgi:hypothetical protein
MRCLFTMFAEDVGLIPENSFTELLSELRRDLGNFQDMVRSLWQTMDTGGFSPILRSKLRRFNGGLFEDCEVLPLDGPQLELLVQAGRANWREVEPAIFGTLLERALDPVERHKLGPHKWPHNKDVPADTESVREDASVQLTSHKTTCHNYYCDN